jgi:hypothetical protein
VGAADRLLSAPVLPIKLQYRRPARNPVLVRATPWLERYPVEPPRRPCLSSAHEDQVYLCGRASYELAGCRCLTFIHFTRGRPGTVRRRVSWIREDGRASGPFLVPADQKGPTS